MTLLYVYSNKTGECVATREAAVDIKQPERLVVPPFQTPSKKPDDALLAGGEFWAYLNEQGTAPINHVDGTWQKQQRPEKVTAYHKQTLEQKEFDDKPLVTDEYTLDKPKTQHDEWINNQWVTNQSNKYIADFDQIDNARRSSYRQICDPLISEACMKRLNGAEQEALELEKQALAARDKIQIENPWPENI
ncbi:hypothetical protein AB4189_08045 [Vibrio sp. 10N.286.49.E1]|uniref:hypothetical protein n=1 Tax=Vibrio sp. 10N.286.49.E1 TaxID=3229702 RepID=UPI003552A35D